MVLTMMMMRARMRMVDRHFECSSHRPNVLLHQVILQKQSYTALGAKFLLNCFESINASQVKSSIFDFAIE